MAIIFKDSSDEMIRKLGNDIFMHFGLGCRNVSKIFVEKGVDLSHIMEVLHENKTLILHNKYKNNYDYNYTIYLLNKEDFLMNGALLLRRNESIHSRISTVHYEEFITEGELLAKISSHSEDLQCLVSEKPIKNFDVIQPGMTQRPSLMDYADHVDTISFLQNI